MRRGWEHEFCSLMTLLWVLASRFIGCVVLDKLLNLSAFQCAHPLSEDNYIACLLGFWRIELMYIKHLASTWYVVKSYTNIYYFPIIIYL